MKVGQHVRKNFKHEAQICNKDLETQSLHPLARDVLRAGHAFAQLAPGYCADASSRQSDSMPMIQSSDKRISITRRCQRWFPKPLKSYGKPHVPPGHLLEAAWCLATVYVASAASGCFGLHCMHKPKIGLLSATGSDLETAYSTDMCSYLVSFLNLRTDTHTSHQFFKIRIASVALKKHFEPLCPSLIKDKRKYFCDTCFPKPKYLRNDHPRQQAVRTFKMNGPGRTEKQ